MTVRIVLKWWLAAAFFAIAGGCEQSADGLLAKGDAAIARGEYRTALIHLKSALRSDPSNVRARWLLGEVYLAMEQGADAEKEIRRAQQAGMGDDATMPALAQALLLQDKTAEVLELPVPPTMTQLARGEMVAAQALAHLARGDKAEADGLSNVALELAPDARLPMMARVRVLADANLLEDAQNLLRKLQEAYPDYGVAWSLLGGIEDVRGDLAKAEESYTIAISKRAVPYADMLNRALIRLRRQDVEGALADSGKLTKALPNLAEAWYVAGAAFFLKADFERAQESLSRANELDGDHFKTVILLGWANLELENLNQAIVHAERAVAMAPNAAPSRLLMAAVRLKLQEPQLAEEAVRPVVAALPDNMQAKQLLVASLQAQGRSGEVVPLLEQIAAENADSPGIQAGVALALVSAREPEKALPLLDRATRQAPDDPLINEARITAMVRAGRYDEALEAAESYRALNPMEPLALQALGVAQAAKGDLADAIATFRQGLAIEPGQPSISLKLARLLDKIGDQAAAFGVVAEAARVNPGNVEISTAFAAVILRRGDLASAIELLRGALAQDPGNRSASILLAQTLLAQGDAAGALEVLPTEESIDDPMSLMVRGDARLVAGDLPAARNDFERLARMVPQVAQAHFKLSLAYASLGEHSRQQKELEEAVRLDPENADFGLELSRLLVRLGRYDDALLQASRYKLAPDDPRLLAINLTIAERKGDRVERLRLARQLQAAAPSSAHALSLAQALYFSGDTESAVSALGDWLKQHPEDAKVATQLAVLYGRTGREAQAARLLKPLAERYPDNVLILNDLAWYMRLTSPAEALLFAEKAAAAAPTNASIMETYATVLALNGRYEAALNAIDSALVMAPQDVRFRLKRIEMLHAAGDHDAAERELSKLADTGVGEDLQSNLEELQQRIDSMAEPAR